MSGVITVHSDPAYHLELHSILGCPPYNMAFAAVDHVRPSYSLCS